MPNDDNPYQPPPVMLVQNRIACASKVVFLRKKNRNQTASQPEIANRTPPVRVSHVHEKDNSELTGLAETSFSARVVWAGSASEGMLFFLLLLLPSHPAGERFKGVPRKRRFIAADLLWLDSWNLGSTRKKNASHPEAR